MEYHTSACARFRASEKVLSFSHISFLLCHLSLSHSQSFISVLRTITSQISQCINPRSHFSFSFFAYFLEKQTLKLPCFFHVSKTWKKEKKTKNLRIVDRTNSGFKVRKRRSLQTFLSHLFESFLF